MRLARHIWVGDGGTGDTGGTKYLFAQIHLKDEWMDPNRVGLNSIIVVMDTLTLPGAAARLQSLIACCHPRPSISL